MATFQVNGSEPQPSTSISAVLSPKKEPDNEFDEDSSDRELAERQEKEFEALRTEFTARAIAEACRTKGSAALPSYYEGFIKSEPVCLPDLTYFLGDFGAPLPPLASVPKPENADCPSTPQRSPAIPILPQAPQESVATALSEPVAAAPECTVKTEKLCSPIVSDSAAAENALLPVRRDKDEKVYRCEECRAMFTRSSTLKRHQKLHSGIKDRPFKCTECSSSFAYNNHLKTHMRIHTGERPFACDRCDATFARPDGLKIHRRKHTGERPYTCAHCDARFSVAHHLKEHSRVHADNKESAFMCRECGDVLHTAGLLRQHMASHASAIAVATAPADGAASGLDVAGGTTKKPFKCEQCTFSFQCRAHLATHMRIHTGERPYACSECSASFARPDGLKIHRRTHTGERPYACTRCDARFSMAHHLRQHAQRHTGEKPFICPECGDNFSTSNRLKLHRRVHTGEKPFECLICKARFMWSDYLRVHMRTHTGERPYACDECGAAFARSDILKVHRRTHTGERPYACRTCESAFKTLGQLQSHCRVHHGQTVPPGDGVVASFGNGVEDQVDECEDSVTAAVDMQNDDEDDESCRHVESDRDAESGQDDEFDQDINEEDDEDGSAKSSLSCADQITTLGCRL